MPKLLVFAPCERAIVDQSNVVSLISVLQEITVEIPEIPVTQGRVPVVPLKWYVVSLWLKTDDDAPDTVYRQRFSLIDPTGASTGLEAPEGDFSFGDKTNYLTIGTVLGFPINHDGRFVLRLWLHRKDAPKGDPVAEFPIMLIRARPKD